MFKRSLLVGFFIVLVALVCGGLVWFNLFRSQMIADFFANQQMPAVTVSATEAKPITWTPAIEAIGTLFAAQGVDVAAPIAGVVRSVEFRANDTVTQGQLLVQIDDAVERADLLSAQANVERDRAQLQRSQTLSQRGVSSEASLETAQTALAASESALARIQATIDLKAVEAPFAGTVGIPRVEVGQYVQPGDMIATLQQLGTMRVDFTVPEQQLGALEIGQPALFGLTEQEFPYEGRIVGIDPKVDPQTRMVSVRAEVGNPAGELMPGQFVRIRVQLPPVENVIALPQTAVVTSLYGDYVFVIEEAPPAAAGAPPAEQPETGDDSPAPEAAAPPAESAQAAADPAAAAQAPQGDGAAPAAQNAAPQLVARQVFVQAGRRQGSLVEITGGLQPGQRVVTSGQNKLANNAPVIINNEVDPAEVALGEGNGRT